jgi:hypothetical protein
MTDTPRPQVFPATIPHGRRGRRGRRVKPGTIVSVSVTINGETAFHDFTADEATALANGIHGVARRLSGGVTTDATNAAVDAFFALSHDIDPESPGWYHHAY